MSVLNIIEQLKREVQESEDNIEDLRKIIRKKIKQINVLEKEKEDYRRDYQNLLRLYEHEKKAFRYLAGQHDEIAAKYAKLKRTVNVLLDKVA